MKITFIGDVHGQIDQLVSIVKICSVNNESCICVGDLGFENAVDRIKHFLWMYFDMFYSVAGNHDYYPIVKSYNPAPYLPNFNVFNCIGQCCTYQIFTVNGAESIDRHLRREGVDWFAEEELTYQEGLQAFDRYIEVKPEIVVSHDCPQKVMEKLFGYSEKSSTRQLLQAMFDEHKPELWIFGHHHKSIDVEIDGTRFICLAELETFTFEF